jgi:hypothetical protein
MHEVRLVSARLRSTGCRLMRTIGSRGSRPGGTLENESRAGEMAHRLRGAPPFQNRLSAAGKSADMTAERNGTSKRMDLKLLTTAKVAA